MFHNQTESNRASFSSYRLLLRNAAAVVPAGEARCPAIANTRDPFWRRSAPKPAPTGGPVEPQPVVTNPYNGSSYDIAQRQRLYNWYNCSGCHSQGGGGIGPPLIKKAWIYGGEPENLFDTIVKGRPNGMPSWGGRIPEYQIWQIIAYIRSLNGEQPKSATPGRSDTIQTNPQTLKSRTTGNTK